MVNSRFVETTSLLSIVFIIVVVGDDSILYSVSRVDNSSGAVKAHKKFSYSVTLEYPTKDVTIGYYTS